MVVGRQSFADEPLGPTATGGSSLLWCAIVGGIGSFGGGYVGSIGAYGLCSLALALPTSGSSPLWCAVVGGIGSFGGGYAGSILGSKGGEFIYDVTERVADW